MVNSRGECCGANGTTIPIRNPCQTATSRLMRSKPRRCLAVWSSKSQDCALAGHVVETLILSETRQVVRKATFSYLSMASAFSILFVCPLREFFSSKSRSHSFEKEAPEAAIPEDFHRQRHRVHQLRNFAPVARKGHPLALYHARQANPEHLHRKLQRTPSG